MRQFWKALGINLKNCFDIFIVPILDVSSGDHLPPCLLGVVILVINEAGLPDPEPYCLLEFFARPRIEVLVDPGRDGSLLRPDKARADSSGLLAARCMPSGHPKHREILGGDDLPSSFMADVQGRQGHPPPWSDRRLRRLTHRDHPQTDQSPYCNSGTEGRAIHLWYGSDPDEPLG